MTKFNIQTAALTDGLKAVLLPREEVKTVTFMVLIGVGSRYETPRQSGLSHFLEHMFFKGTTNRPTTKEIAEAIDNVGGEFNAFTGEEYTGYYVKVAEEHLERGADVVADILLNPLFPKEEIERERGVIIEEMRMYTDSPMSHVGHLWNKALYGDHPLGRRIDGEMDTVKALQRRDFVSYVKKHYHTGNAVVAVAGKFDPQKTKAMLERLLAPLSKGAATEPKKAPKKLPVQRLSHEHRKTLDQTHLIVGVPGVSMCDDRRWAAEVLAVVLGGGMSSRMFLSVRERNGLAYSVRTGSDNLTDTGSFATQAGVRTDKAVEALKLIIAEYDRAMNEPVSSEELIKAKQMLRGRMLIDLEETNAMAIFAGSQQLLVNEIETPEVMLDKIDAVTAEDVQKVAQELLAPEQRSLALLGPQRSASAFEKVVG